jgi:predicted Zn-dependent protease
MRSLKAEEQHCVNAAMGWIELGNPKEAIAELSRIPLACREHPAVLEVQWRIHADLQQWESAFAIGKRLVELAPDKPGSWINQSFALHELKRTQEAWKVLLPAAGKFPEISTIPYNLACYACQLGDHVEARRWLARAVEMRNREEIKQLALADKDLEPLWLEIQEW